MKNKEEDKQNKKEETRKTNNNKTPMKERSKYSNLSEKKIQKLQEHGFDRNQANELGSSPLRHRPELDLYGDQEQVARQASQSKNRTNNRSNSAQKQNTVNKSITTSRNTSTI